MFTKFHWSSFILAAALPGVPAAESSAPIAALEAKAQVHPSFGNNFNSRTEPDHVGQVPVPEDCDPAELAAWTSVSRVLFNLHETITRN